MSFQPFTRRARLARWLLHRRDARPRGPATRFPGFLGAAVFLGLAALLPPLLLTASPARTMLAVVTATMTAQIIGDDGDGAADPGETIRYTTTITNGAATDAAGVKFDDTIDSNTTLVPGSFQTTPLARTDFYESIGHVGITVPAAAGVLANDADLDGSGLAVTPITAFDNPSAGGGAVSLNTSDGSFTYTPAVGFEGTDSFTYTIDDGESNSDVGTVYIAVSDPIWFIDNSAAAAGNGTLASPFKTLAAFEAVNGNGGAGDPDADDAVFVYETGAGAYTGGVTLENGQVLMGQGASSSIVAILGLALPPHSYALPATGGSNPLFTNASGNGIVLASDNAVHGITVGNTSGAGIVGASIGSFFARDASIQDGGAALDLASGTLDVILAGITSTGTSGLDGIRLDNVGGAFTVTGATSLTGVDGAGYRAHGSATLAIDHDGAVTVSNIGSSGRDGVGIDLDPASTVAFDGGLTITTSTNGGAGLRVATTGQVGIGLTTNTINVTGGPGIDVVSTSLGSGWTFSSVSASGGSGINLDGVSGSFAAAGGTLTSPSGVALRVNLGSHAVTFGGAIVNTGGRAVEVTNRTGGVVDLDGPITDSGQGVLLNNNGAGTVNFDGGVQLTTGAQPAFTATGGGTVNVTGANNTLATTTGTALRVTDTQIGSSGLTFASISSNGAANGIVLTNTGTSGGLTVTGTGGANSGGTITNATGDGVLLSGVRSVSLTDMRITNSADSHIDMTSITTGLALTRLNADQSGSHGLLGSSVRNLTLTDCVIDHSGDADAPLEDGLNVTNLLGSSAITGSAIRNSRGNNVFVDNTVATAAPPGAPDALVISGSAITTTLAGGDNGVFFRGRASANMKLTVHGSSSVTGSQKDGIRAFAENGSRVEAFVDGVTLTSNAGSAVNVSTAQTARGIADVRNLGGVSAGLNVINFIGFDGSTLDATVEDVVITASATGSGLRAIQEGNGLVRAKFKNNRISGIEQASGIIAQARAGTGTLELTLEGNTISNLVAVMPILLLEGVRLESGSSAGGDANTLCLNMFNNSSTVAAASAQEGYFLRQRTGTTFKLADFAGNGASAGDIANWVNVVKSNVGTTQILIGSSFTGGAACAPPMPIVASLDAVASAGTAARGGPRALEPEPVGAPASPADDPAPKVEPATDAPAGAIPPSRTPRIAPAHSSAATARAPSLLAPGMRHRSTTIRGAERLAGAMSRGVPVAASSAAALATPRAGIGARSASRGAVPIEAAGIAPPVPHSGESVHLDIGVLPAGKSITITFDVTVDPAATGVSQICNQATITGDTFGPIVTDDPATGAANDATCLPLDAAPDLTLTKDDGGITVTPGTTIPYTLAYANTGTQGATGVAITETVPANTTFDAGASTAGWSCVPDANAGSVCTFTLGTVDAGASGSVIFAVTVDNPVAAGTDAISNTASIADDGANGPDLNPPDNSATDSTPVDAMPEITATKTDQLVVDGNGDGIANPGETLRYTVVLANSGAENAAGVTFEDLAADHAHTTLVPGTVTSSQGAVTSGNAAGDTDVRVNVGNLIGGGPTVTITFDVVIDLPFPTGTSQVQNQGSVSGNFTTVRTDDPDTGAPDDPTITEVVSNRPPTIDTVTPATQTVQYSDGIVAVTIVASDPDDDPLTLSATAPLPSALSLASVSPGTWSLRGQMLAAPGTYTITVIANDGALDSDPATVTLTVVVEDARVAFDPSNPVGVEVMAPGGSSKPFSLKVHVREFDNPNNVAGDLNLAGDITKAGVSVSLVPVGPGSGASPIGCTLTSSAGLADPDSPFDYDVLTLTCGFENVPVNTYAIVVTVGGTHYAGEGEDVLVVFDPSLGFTTGGGTFFWPGTADPGTGYLGDRTNFGFNVQYVRRGNSIKGGLLLVRHLADGSLYRLKSNAMDGLSVGSATDAAGPYGWASFVGKATYREPTWPVPIGNYAFTAYVEDRGTPGAGKDRFWIEVRDRLGAVVAALSLPKPGTANAVAIASGNIVVPHEPRRGNNRLTDDEPVTPIRFALVQNQPNPFGPETMIRFELPRAVHVRLTVYDMAGREVARLVDGTMPAGVHRTPWRARGLPAGMYLYRIEAGEFTATRRAILLR